MQNNNELHSDRLATTDSQGHRVYLYPEEVKGRWKNYREIVYYFLIALYLVVPWFKINGKQSMLLDIPNREFTILGASFYAHNIPLLLIVILLFVFTIGFLTALFGRVWCGWACPQTVFIESIFRKIELLIEGKSRQRLALDRGPLTTKKIYKKIFKWTLFLLVSLVISHSTLAYFVQTEELVKIVQLNPRLNPTLFFSMIMLTSLFLFDFGWFREQFCIIACPYGRFQSVLMDQDSLVVSYDPKRGEPRKTDTNTPHGDCINCYKCVHVCPTGIDIRRGTQLECIHCTRCIDECDTIMEHIGKPKGLIRYATERQIETGKLKIARPRIFIYATILAIFTIIGATIIHQSKNLRVLFIRGTKAPYQVVQSNKREVIVNHYKAELFYRADKIINLKFRTEDPNVTVVTPMKNIKLQASKKQVVHIFFKFNRKALTNGTKSIQVKLYDQDKHLKTKEVTLVGPLN